MNADRTGSRPVPAALYPGLLGEAAWCALPEAVRRAHLGGSEPVGEDETVAGSGDFTIRYGAAPPARLLARLLRLPPAAEAVPTRLCIIPDGGRRGERWSRSFGGRRLVTRQREAPGGLLAERVGGALEFRFRLEADERGLSYRQHGPAALAFRSWRLPLPRWASPRVEAREEPAAAVVAAGGPDRPAARVHVRVEVTLPLVGRLITYEGDIEVDTIAEPPPC